jgi:hypothetical protein
VEFDRANTEWMTLGAVTDTSNDWTVIAILNQVSLPGAQSLVATNNTGLIPAALETTTADTVGGHDGTAYRDGPGGLLGDQWLEWHWNSATPLLTCYRNGTSLGTATYDATLEFSNSATLGALSDGTLPADCIVSEVIIYNRILTAGELVLLRAYILARYALSWSLADIGGNILWLDAALGTTETGSGVSTWLDQSPEGNNATQTTDADRPALLPTGGVNGLPGVEFDASNTEFLDLTGLTDASNDYTLFGIVNQVNAGARQFILGTNSLASGFGLEGVAASANKVCIYDGAYRSDADLLIGEQYLEWHVNKTANTFDVYRDGSQITSVTPINAIVFANTVTLGAFNGTLFPSDAILSELILFNRILTTEELALVRAYIETKFALSWSLNSIAGNILWLDAALGTTETGSGVSTWLDQSPEGNNATQTTDADRPALLPTGGVNGLPGVEFDKADTEWMSLGTITEASDDWTVFAVYDQQAFVTQHLISGLDSAGTHIFAPAAPGSFPVTNIGGYDGTAWRSATAAKLGEQYCEWHWNSLTTTVSVYREGALIGTTAYDATGGFGGAIDLGRLYTGGSELDAILSEIIIFNRILTTEELALVRAYIETKFALSFSPLSVADLTCWLDSDAAYITLNGSDVATWSDRSGAGNDVAQATPANQPLYVSSGGPNNLPYVEFDGASEYVDGSWVQNQPTTRFSVLLPSVSDTGSAIFVLDGAAVNSQALFKAAGQSRLYMWAGKTLQSDQVIAMDSWHYLTTEYNGVSSSISVNGSVPVTGDAGANNPSGLTIGASGAPSAYADCRVCAFLEYGRALTDEEITSLETWITALTGL